MEIKDFINKGDLVFDIGANVGVKTQQYLDMGASVVAVEPQPYCIDVLRKKFADKDVKIVPFGVSNCRRKRTLHIGTSNTISTMSQEFMDKTKDRFWGYDWKESIKVETLTMDDLIEQFGTPRFAKIDVEGHEEDVFLGLRSAIPFISFEYTPELHSNFICCCMDIEEIAPCKYNFGLGEHTSFVFPDWITWGELNDYLLTTVVGNVAFGDVYVKMWTI